MKKIHIFTLSLLSALALLLSGCTDNPNDWPTEGGEKRLFQPVIFETSNIKATWVELKFTTILDASEYIVEFSRDDFETIENQYVLLADTMNAFAKATDPMRTEYRYPFYDLFGTSDYQARLKGRSQEGVESKFSTVEFRTSEDYLFSRYFVTLTDIKALWEPTELVSHVVLYRVVEKDEDSPQNDVLEELESRPVSATDASLSFTGLTPGTEYQVIMWYDDILRGRIAFSTLGVAGAAIYEVQEEDNYETLAEKLAGYVAAGSKDVTLSFRAGKSYQMGGRLIFPSGINDVYFAGAEEEDGSLPMLDNLTFEIETSMGNATFRNLAITGGGGMMFQANGEKSFKDVVFENCKIRQLNSILYLTNGGSGNSILVNNCLVSNTGGWGMLNCAANAGGIGKITVTNSTLTEINTRFADIRIKTELVFDRITCVNMNEAMGHLWLFDNTANTLSTVSITNMIIGGPNAGTKLHSTNGNYSIMPSYEGNYITSDLEQDTRELTGITELPLDIYGLFVDPENGDFHLKKGIGFAGDGVAGDPRWDD